jgi:hypothetical protein
MPDSMTSSRISMTERAKRKAGSKAARAQQVQAEEAERSLGRAVAVGLPAAAVLGAVLVSVVASFGSGIIILASGALVGAIALLWASVRTLSGDAPLPTDLEALAARGHGIDELEEEKRRVLRALKDLESEHAIGKIDDADYDAIVGRYREDAKELMRQIDSSVAPLRGEAERIAREYLEKKLDNQPTEPASTADARATCVACGTSNERDADFCKKCGAPIKPADAAEGGTHAVR